MASRRLQQRLHLAQHHQGLGMGVERGAALGGLAGGRVRGHAGHHQLLSHQQGIGPACIRQVG